MLSFPPSLSTTLSSSGAASSIKASVGRMMSTANPTNPAAAAATTPAAPAGGPTNAASAGTNAPSATAAAPPPPSTSSGRVAGGTSSSSSGAGMMASSSVSGAASTSSSAPMPGMPDLSHLTAEERKIIESVMERQRNEEQREEVRSKRNSPAEFKIIDPFLGSGSKASRSCRIHRKSVHICFCPSVRSFVHPPLLISHGRALAN